MKQKNFYWSFYNLSHPTITIGFKQAGVDFTNVLIKNLKKN